MARLFKPVKLKGKTHIMFCFVDHYEPDWGKADAATRLERVRRWVKGYPLMAQQHCDADGRPPQHTFFYPAEVYEQNLLNELAVLINAGYGEVEVHLHHDGDTEASLRVKLEQGKKDLGGHGFLGKRPMAQAVRFAFIHGNWALNNSRPDGCWCGVNDESRVLAEAGCYADFTFPSAPSNTQPSKINSIYYTKSDPRRPKSHNKGVDVCVGTYTKGQHLMIIQGPLALNFKRRKFGVLPRIENGDVTGTNPPTADRVDLWIKQGIAVAGRPDWIFVKVHTHGAPEKNAGVLLGEPCHAMYSYLEKNYNDGERFCLHYVTAREMYNIIKAAEAGENGNPGSYRDYFIEKNSTLEAQQHG
ncbi:MAG: hypothetical protein KGK03_06655 [Candidatus Omnitrophica bacterium]|nr:hypothetical protein [Candidatus Omnitrophota bacterium]MDE2222733.1 hypothetical protein [Candidatus Omnitrophota bacterium]